MGIYFDGVGYRSRIPSPRVPLDRDRHSFFAPVTPPPTLHQSPDNGNPSVFIRAYIRGITRQKGGRYNLFLIGNLFFEFRRRAFPKRTSMSPFR